MKVTEATTARKEDKEKKRKEVPGKAKTANIAKTTQADNKHDDSEKAK